jgi:hypothetical protein
VLFPAVTVETKTKNNYIPLGVFTNIFARCMDHIHLNEIKIIEKHILKHS